MKTSAPASLPRRAVIMPTCRTLLACGSDGEPRGAVEVRMRPPRPGCAGRSGRGHGVRCRVPAHDQLALLRVRLAATTGCLRGAGSRGPPGRCGCCSARCTVAESAPRSLTFRQAWLTVPQKQLCPPPHVLMPSGSLSAVHVLLYIESLNES